MARATTKPAELEQAATQEPATTPPAPLSVTVENFVPGEVLSITRDVALEAALQAFPGYLARNPDRAAALAWDAGAAFAAEMERRRSQQPAPEIVPEAEEVPKA